MKKNITLAFTFLILALVHTEVVLGQTALRDPESRKKAAKKFTKPMIKHLLKKGIIKKPE